MNILLLPGNRIKLHKGRKAVTCMRQLAKTLGAAALAFGAGALMGLVLPPAALAFIEAALIVCAGAALFIK